MNKPTFNPNQPFEVADKPAFDPNQPFQVEDQQSGNESFLGNAWNEARAQVSNTPMGIVAGFQDTIDTGAKKLGEFATKSFQRNGFNMAPLLSPAKKVPVSSGVSKILGKTIEYAPAIASILATPIESSGPAVKSAVPFARRALGFQKSMLKTPFARGQATKSAEMALEKNIIPLSGNPQTMFKNASELALKSGESIGSTLKNTPINPDIVISNLNSLKGQLTKGLPSGVFESASSTVDDVIKDLNVLNNRAKGSLGLVPQKGEEITANIVNQIKTRVGQKLNYLSDLASQTDNKALVNNLANTIRDAVKSFTTPEEFAQYLTNQKQYGAAQLMLKGLNNEIAGQMGNAGVSLPSTIIGAGELATGNPIKAAATMGLTEGIKRRGAGATASILQKTGTNAPSIGLVVSESFKNLTKSKAAEFLDQANGDKVKARELAKEAGYKWPTSSTK